MVILSSILLEKKVLCSFFYGRAEFDDFDDFDLDFDDDFFLEEQILMILILILMIFFLEEQILTILISAFRYSKHTRRSWEEILEVKFEFELRDLLRL